MTIDSNAWAEIFGGVGRDEAAAVELLGGLQRDESAEVEFLGGLRRDEAVRIEDLAGSQLDGSAEVELLAGLRREEPLQSEESSNIRRDETLPIEEISSALSTFDAVVHPESLANSTLDAQAGGEVLAGDRSDSSAPLELSRAVSAVDAVIRLEGTASVSLDVNTVAEMLSGLRGELPVPLEAGSDISVYDAVAQAEFARTVSAADAVAQAEFIPGVSLDARAGVEITDSIVGDTAPPVELLGPLFAATGDSGLPLDYSGAVLRDAAAPVEFDGAVSMFDALATIEGLADVVRDTAPRDEILSQVDADAPLPVDYQSNVIISAEAVAPFEVLVAALHNAISQLELESAQSTDATLGSEVLAGVRRDVNVLVESLGNFAVTGDVPALIEIFGYAVTDSGSPPNIEILGSVRYDSVVNADWSAYLLVDDRADAEFLVAVNRDAIAQLEIITQQHFASDSNAQMEITVAVSTESTLPTEFISAIVRYDSNTQTEWTALQSLDNQGAANLEFLQNFSAESGVPVEILRTIFLFSGDAGVPLEITFKISTTQQDVGVPLEIMKFARVRRNRNQLYSTLWSGIDDIGGTWN